MLKLITNNQNPSKRIENLPWSLIQLGTLNNMSAADIVKLAKDRK